MLHSLATVDRPHCPCRTHTAWVAATRAVSLGGVLVRWVFAFCVLRTAFCVLRAGNVDARGGLAERVGGGRYGTRAEFYLLMSPWCNDARLMGKGMVSSTSREYSPMNARHGHGGRKEVEVEKQDRFTAARPAHTRENIRRRGEFFYNRDIRPRPMCDGTTSTEPTPPHMAQIFTRSLQHTFFGEPRPPHRITTHLQLIMLAAVIRAVGISHGGLHGLRGVARRALRRLGRRLCRLAHALGQGGLGVVARLVLALERVHLVLAVLLDELGEVFDGARAGVGDWFLFATGGEEFDGREALDFVGDVVGCGVHFGDGDFGAGGIHGSELFVFGGQAIGEWSEIGLEDAIDGALTLCSGHTRGRRTREERHFHCPKRSPCSCWPQRPEQGLLASLEPART